MVLSIRNVKPVLVHSPQGVAECHESCCWPATDLGTPFNGQRPQRPLQRHISTASGAERSSFRSWPTTIVLGAKTATKYSPNVAECYWRDCKPATDLRTPSRGQRSQRQPQQHFVVASNAQRPPAPDSGSSSTLDVWVVAGHRWCGSMPATALTILRIDQRS